MPDMFANAAAKYKSRKMFSDAAAKYKEASPDVTSQRKSKQQPGFWSGIKGSSSGQIFGGEPEELSEDASLFDRLAFKAGGLVGDIPAMAIGGLVTGGMGGQFAAPELIKQIAGYIKKPSSGTVLGGLSDLIQIPYETGKQAVVGKVAGLLGGLAGAGKIIPATSKLMQSKVGRGAVSSGAELLGMTGAQSAMEGEMPGMRDLAENALLLGAMKGVAPLAKFGAKKLGVKEISSRMKKSIMELEPVKKHVVKPIEKIVEKFNKSKPFYDMVRKNLGEKDARIIKNQMKWRKAVEKTPGAKDITKTQLEDAIYYAQKTKNPFLEGDTFEKLSGRVGEPLRRIVDKQIRPHMEGTLKEVNKQLYTKKINPREGLAEKYMPGMYENSEKFPSIEQKVSKQMKFKNPFADPKTFLDYNEAWIKAGLKPRFKNIFELVDSFDQVNAKNIAGSNLLTEISKSEKSSGDRLIVTSRDPIDYHQAKAQGYVPFEDMTLRGYTPEGKLVRPTVKPALVAPEVAGAIQGIFSKEAYKPTNKIVKALRNLSDVYRLGRVRLSYFHYVPLTESSSGALGVKKAFGFRDIAKKGSQLRGSEVFMEDAARHGLKISEPVERFQSAMKTTDKLVSLSEKYMPTFTKGARSKYNLHARAISAFARSQDYMFKHYHPNLKAVTYSDFVARALEKATKEGKSLSKGEIYKLKTGMADVVNNMYGGQNWNMQRVFNSQKGQAWLRDLIAYPDWTTSAIKQAANAFAPGLKGEASRKYWMRFGINYLATHGLLKFLSGTIKKDKNGWSIDPARGLKEIMSPDPLSWYKFPLPDIDIKIGGYNFNPGRDERGRRLHSHLGKQALEIKDWVYHPFTTYFGKANPLIQEAYKQLTGRTPGKDTDYTVRGKRKGGEFVPFDATRPGTPKRVASRALAAAEGLMPFSIGTAAARGAGPFIATGLGAIPISVGTTLTKAKPELEKAFRKKDVKMVNRIRKALKENGFKYKQIRSVVNAAKRETKKEIVESRRKGN